MSMVAATARRWLLLGLVVISLAAGCSDGDVTSGREPSGVEKEDTAGAVADLPLIPDSDGAAWQAALARSFGIAWRGLDRGVSAYNDLSTAVSDGEGNQLVGMVMVAQDRRSVSQAECEVMGSGGLEYLVFCAERFGYRDARPDEAAAWVRAIAPAARLGEECEVDIGSARLRVTGNDRIRTLEIVARGYSSLPPRTCATAQATPNAAATDQCRGLTDIEVAAVSEAIGWDYAGAPLTAFAVDLPDAGRSVVAAVVPETEGDVATVVIDVGSAVASVNGHAERYTDLPLTTAADASTAGITAYDCVMANVS